MKEFIKTEVKAETAVLVGLITRTQDERKTAEYLDELEFLAETAGAVTVKRFTQRLDSPSSVTYVGKGKLEEIKCYIEAEEEAEREIGMVIFDDELSAKQLRNIEKELKVKILDRTSLILDIFAMRAQTANAKTQVELAQYRYMLPRLQRLWTHLERQGGGSGSGGGKGSVGLRGPGETQLETDRRLLRNRIVQIQSRLERVEKQREQGRQSRIKADVPTVSLVGYTNAGKSTLFNRITEARVYAADQLFATLDPTLRRIDVADVGETVLADTVGFIRHLPHDLVAAFKATLQETRQATLLLHVIDAADVRVQENIEAVNTVLEEIDAHEIPTLQVMNKIDMLEDFEPRIDRDEENKPIRVWLSAQTGAGIPQLFQALTERLRRIILNRMALLKQRLAEIDTQKSTQRKNRGRLIRVALVGYTNVGKSTLMNLMAKSEVFAENKLFATLDTTVRKVIIENLPFLLSDTVGFIRKLPTDLVDSFKSTLDEVREADLLVHVVDISHPDFEEQIQVVDKTIADLGAGGKPTVIVFNKIDASTYVEKAEDDLTPKTKENITLDELMRTWMAKMHDNCIFISARNKTNIEELRALLYGKIRELHVQKYPYNDFLYQTYEE